MESITKYRDIWASGKQIAPELADQLAKATGAELDEVRRGIEALIKAGNQISKSRSFSDYYGAVEELASVSRQIAHASHKLRMFCDFQVPPATTFADHFVNQFFLMSALKRTWWVEGPVFCGLCIDPGARILELGCGAGYYTDIFFAPFAADITAVDIDPRAIEFAKRFHQAKNIRYIVADFRRELPDGPFDVVIWTPTIFAYTPDEVDDLLRNLAGRLTSQARLCGFTAVESEHAGEGVLWHDIASLGARLRKHFAHVRVFERTHHTIQPPRTNMYFLASDGVLPFDDGWERGFRV